MTDILLTGMRYDELRARLRARRESLGLTQGDLARMMGTAAAAISNWERGAGSLPTLDTLIRWHRALHVELGFVMTPREDRYESPLDWNDD